MRVRIAVPSGALVSRLDEMPEWLDANCGGDAWAMIPSGKGGVVGISEVNGERVIHTLASDLRGPMVRRSDGRDR
jgi:hypothetical protein